MYNVKIDEEIIGKSRNVQRFLIMSRGFSVSVWFEWRSIWGYLVSAAPTVWSQAFFNEINDEKSNVG